MHKLNFPDYTFKITKDGDSLVIFDELRKKHLVLTPEEWVRQNLIKYLITTKGYPQGLISSEAGLKVNTLQKRYDALVYSKKMTPQILIECKAPTIKINESVFQQILIYNSEIKAPYMLITNGITHFFLRKNQDGRFIFSPTIPNYNNLLNAPE